MPKDQVIIRQHVIDRFNNDFVSKIGYSWSRHNLPGPHADPNQFDYNINGNPNINNISSGVITASTLTNNLQSIASWYTNVRNCRYIETTTNQGVVNTTVDRSAIAIFNTGYRQGFYGGNIGPANAVITDGSLDINSFFNRWIVYRNNTVTLTYNTYTQWNDHSSRSRR